MLGRGVLIVNTGRKSLPVQHVSLYTDGSLKHARMGVGVASCAASSMRVRLSGYMAGARIGKPDNNAAEMYAIVAALHVTDPWAPLVLHTDSMCCMRMMATSRAHAKFAPAMRAAQHLLAARREPIWLFKVKAHAGVVGNEMADSLAKAGTVATHVKQHAFMDDMMLMEC